MHKEQGRTDHADSRCCAHSVVWPPVILNAQGRPIKLPKETEYPQGKAGLPKWFRLTATAWQGIQAIASVLLLIATGFLACYAVKQWRAMNDTLIQIRTQTSAIQLSAVGSFAGGISSAVQTGISQKALESNEQQSTAARVSAILMSQEERRPWVGVVGVNTDDGSLGPNEPTANKTFAFKKVSIVIRNSGKTPALKLSVSPCEPVVLPFDKPVPDYDAVVKADAEDLKRHYEQTLKQMWPWIKNRPDLIKRAEDTYRTEKNLGMIEHRRGVLPPDVPQELTIVSPGRRLPATQDTGRAVPIPLTHYILGKITYNDTFIGTAEHSTTFCLMRADLRTDFAICPDGNSMK